VVPLGFFIVVYCAIPNQEEILLKRETVQNLKLGKKGYKKNHPDQRVIMMKRFYSQKKILVLG
jgi:hypothetical protein